MSSNKGILKSNSLYCFEICDNTKGSNDLLTTVLKILMKFSCLDPGNSVCFDKLSFEELTVKGLNLLFSGELGVDTILACSFFTEVSVLLFSVTIELTLELSLVE